MADKQQRRADAAAAAAAAALQPLRKSVTLEEGTLVSMASNPAFLREFPLLNSLANLLRKQPKSCGTCGRAAQLRSQVMTAVKNAIFALASDRKRVLRDMLRAREVHIVIRDRFGRGTPRSF